MKVVKESRSRQGIREVHYDDVRKHLTIKMMNGDALVFKGVPWDVAYGMPTGVNAWSYVARKVQGNFEMEFISFDDSAIADPRQAAIDKYMADLAIQRAKEKEQAAEDAKDKPGSPRPEENEAD